MANRRPLDADTGGCKGQNFNSHFKNNIRPTGVRPLYLVSLQYQPPAASRWPNIIFDMRIEILTITNLHLDIHSGILVLPLYLYLFSLQQLPVGLILFLKCELKYWPLQTYIKTCIKAYWSVTSISVPKKILDLEDIK